MQYLGDQLSFNCQKYTQALWTLKVFSEIQFRSCLKSAEVLVPENLWNHFIAWLVKFLKSFKNCSHHKGLIASTPPVHLFGSSNFERIFLVLSRPHSPHFHTKQVTVQIPLMTLVLGARVKIASGCGRDSQPHCAPKSCLWGFVCSALRKQPKHLASCSSLLSPWDLCVEHGTSSAVCTDLSLPSNVSQQQHVPS